MIMKLASFDIFDTVLIRRCGKPDQIFSLMAKHLYPGDVARQDEFIKWRISRNVEGLDKNYVLDDVYATSDIKSFPEYTAEALIRMELKIEAEQLTRNNCAVSVLDEYRRKGYKIAFISDMYLYRDFIQRVLVRERIFKEKDRVYVSSEIGCRKDDGSLFDYVREELHPDEWIHCGDNEYSDCKIPEKKGIKIHRLFLPYTDMEKSMDKLSVMLSDAYDLSLLAGMERTVRSEFLDTSASRIAVDFLSAAYIPYVRYLLADARKRGLKRLYFLSRDSYILEKIASWLPHDGITLKYLFVSRASLILPYLYRANREQFNLIFVNEWLYIDQLLGCLKLSRQLLCELGITFDFVKVTTKKQRQEFLDAVFRPDIYAIWQKAAGVQYNLCTGYFDQEGLFDACPCALVDVGWLGTTRLMINTIRETVKPGIVQCYSYYWSVRPDVIPGEFGHYNIYIHDIKVSPELTFFVEDYFSLCPYPTTEGYKGTGVCYEPVLKKDVDMAAITVRVSYNEKILKAFISLIMNFHIPEQIFYTWTVFSIESLQNFRLKDVDYSPFENICADQIPLVKKLSVSELRKILKGKWVSRIDRASLLLSYGYRMGNFFWNRSERRTH